MWAGEPRNGQERPEAVRRQGRVGQGSCTVTLEIQSGPGPPYFWRPLDTSGWGYLPCWWVTEMRESTSLLQEYARHRGVRDE